MYMYMKGVTTEYRCLEAGQAPDRMGGGGASNYQGGGRQRFGEFYLENRAERGGEYLQVGRKFVILGLHQDLLES